MPLGVIASERSERDAGSNGCRIEYFGVRSHAAEQELLWFETHEIASSFVLAMTDP